MGAMTQQLCEEYLTFPLTYSMEIQFIIVLVEQLTKEVNQSLNQ